MRRVGGEVVSRNVWFSYTLQRFLSATATAATATTVTVAQRREEKKEERREIFETLTRKTKADTIRKKIKLRETPLKPKE